MANKKKVPLTYQSSRSSFFFSFSEKKWKGKHWVRFHRIPRKKEKRHRNSVKLHITFINQIFHFTLFRFHFGILWKFLRHSEGKLGVRKEVKFLSVQKYEMRWMWYYQKQRKSLGRGNFQPLLKRLHIDHIYFLSVKTGKLLRFGKSITSSLSPKCMWGTESLQVSFPDRLKTTTTKGSTRTFRSRCTILMQSALITDRRGFMVICMSPIWSSKPPPQI